MSRLLAHVPAVIDGRGELAGTGIWLEYYTTEPAPGAWVAVGSVIRCTGEGVPSRALRLLVGSGRSEALAIIDLRQRFDQLDRMSGVRRDTLAPPIARAG